MFQEGYARGGLLQIHLLQHQSEFLQYLDQHAWLSPSSRPSGGRVLAPPRRRPIPPTRRLADPPESPFAPGGSTVIWNPVAGRPSGRRRARRLVERLRRLGFRVVATERAGHAAELSAAAWTDAGEAPEGDRSSDEASQVRERESNDPVTEPVTDARRKGARATRRKRATPPPRVLT